VGANSNTVPALNAQHFSTGNHLRDTLRVLLLDDFCRTIQDTKAIFLAFIFINLNHALRLPFFAISKELLLT
jgi:hypothetical protein